jgi:hypothetical protein
MDGRSRSRAPIGPIRHTAIPDAAIAAACESVPPVARCCRSVARVGFWRDPAFYLEDHRRSECLP